MDPYGGGQQMMSMSMSSISLLACAAIAGAYFLMPKGPSKEQVESEKQAAVASMMAASASSTQVPSSSPSGAVQAGMYTISNGGVGLIVNPKTCTDNRVGFEDPAPGDTHAWNLKPVPNRPGYYYLQSESRLFRQGCNLAYLTAPTNCDGTPVLDTDRWADRQYWELVPSGNGSYQLRNAACAAKRAPSYLASSGTEKGWGKFKMFDRSGTSYVFTPYTQ